MSERDRELKFNKIYEKVDNNGGFLCIRMKELREAYGVKKLGPNVLRAIRKELQFAKLKSVEELGEYQSDCVRLYKTGGPEERLVAAFNDVEVNSDGDAVLTGACMSLDDADYKKAITDIRDIVSSLD
jgi:hypothetical protein